MIDHIFGFSGSEQTIGHAHSEMFTDPHGHLLSTAHTGTDGVTRLTDASGMQVGTATPAHDGMHFTNAAGQQVARIAHDVLYNSSNLPVAEF